jgi:branched-chain amino acid aminotransferase
VTPVIEIDHRRIGEGAIGEITKKLQQLYFDVVRGKNPRYIDWCTPAYSSKTVA